MHRVKAAPTQRLAKTARRARLRATERRDQGLRGRASLMSQILEAFVIRHARPCCKRCHGVLLDASPDASLQTVSARTGASSRLAVAGGPSFAADSGGFGLPAAAAGPRGAAGSPSPLGGERGPGRPASSSQSGGGQGQEGGFPGARSGPLPAAGEGPESTAGPKLSRHSRHRAAAMWSQPRASGDPRCAAPALSWPSCLAARLCSSAPPLLRSSAQLLLVLRSSSRGWLWVLSWV